MRLNRTYADGMQNLLLLTLAPKKGIISGFFSLLYFSPVNYDVMAIVQTQIRRHVIWRLILVCTVYKGPFQGKVSNNGVSERATYLSRTCPLKSRLDIYM